MLQVENDTLRQQFKDLAEKARNAIEGKVTNERIARTTHLRLHHRCTLKIAREQKRLRSQKAAALTQLSLYQRRWTH